MDTLQLLFDKIGDPEYRHLLLEPVLIYGVLLGVVAFVCAFLFKERKMQLAALVVIMVSALTIVPYLKSRGVADQRAERLFSDRAGEIAAQREARKDARWAYFAVAGLAGVTLLMGAHKGKPGLIVGVATVGAGVCLVLFSMAMHLKDAQIYHPNLRGGQAEVAGGRGDPREPPGARDRRALSSRIVEP